MPRPSNIRLEALMKKTWINFKRNFSLYWRVIGLMFIGVLVISVIDQMASGLGTSLLDKETITVGQVISLNLFYKAVIFAVMFLWLIYTQGLIIHSSISEKEITLKSIVADFNKDYKKFVALSLIFAAAAVAAMIPFYGASLVFLSDLPAKLIFGNILLVLFAASLLGLMWFFVFTPHVMLSRHLSVIKTLRYTKDLIKGNFASIVAFLMIPLVILVILNFAMLNIFSRELSILANLTYIFFVLPIMYSYLAELYSQYDRA